MARTLTALLLCLAATLTAHAHAHAQLVPDGAKPEKVADGYRFTEGPALAPDGSIYFTDIPASLILRFDPKTGKTATVKEQSGSANGMIFDHNGQLLACRQGVREVGSAKTTTSPIVFQTAANKLYKGKKLNSPNDLDIDKAGNIYFTDPRYGNRDSMEMQVEGVYFQSREAQTASGMPPLVRIDADLKRPNGIALSPDEKTLYVADWEANQIYAYDIVSPGKVKNKRPFARFTEGNGKGSDGMCVDQRGRLYTTESHNVFIFEPTGELVAKIPVGKHTTNVTFGADGKTLYITANKGLYRIKLNTDAPLQHAQDK